MTTVKPRKPLVEFNQSNNVQSGVLSSSSGDVTVEEYLTKQFDEIIKNIKLSSAGQKAKLRQEFKDGSVMIKDLMDATSNKSKNVYVRLQCIGGSHMGQRFRLEPSVGKTEDIFKIGRSTGRHFKDKGVSLYKDKEISTTHAKIEIRNGQVFLIDVRSTNGTHLNGVLVEAQVPLRLREMDIITMGTTDLQVHISNIDDNSTTTTNNNNSTSISTSTVSVFQDNINTQENK